MTRPGWDFDYRALAKTDGGRVPRTAFVVATERPVEPESWTSAFAAIEPGARCSPMFVRAPIHWYRLDTQTPQDATVLERKLDSAGIPVRYVAERDAMNQSLGPRLDFSNAKPAAPTEWRARSARKGHGAAASTEHHWFLDRRGGIAAVREVCKTGAGTRLAVIDDEVGHADALELDALIGIAAPPPSAGSSHGAALVAWAVGSAGVAARGISPFVGVAPDASPRLYVIPRPGRDLSWFPLALVRAVNDGADVVVCATYVDDATTPMLDDALEFATRLGRGGRGTAVVLPTGREVSSPPGSIHASLTLDFGSPACDPRVLCVAPSSRAGGWFLWADKRGAFRPFANRGPSVRMAAPGDDMAYPFAKTSRLGHAESSGASAIAAGVLLLVLANNPALTLDELVSAVTETAVPPAPVPRDARLADASDVFPLGTDADGHDAKCGYGLLSAVAACVAVTDPIALSLQRMGESEAAERFLVRLRADARVAPPYSEALSRFAARVLLRDTGAAQATAALCRHARLVAGDVERQRSHAPGAMVRAMVLLLDRLAAAAPMNEVKQELDDIRQRCLESTVSGAQRATLENDWFRLASDLWPSHPGTHELTSAAGEPDTSSVGCLDHSA